MTKKEKRQRADRIDKIYRSRCSGIQVGIMDIGKIFSKANEAIDEGVDDVVLGDRIFEFVQTIKKN